MTLFKRGLKKLFSLTRTKIRLAEEADTVKTVPAPLPLVKLFSKKDITTVAEAKEHREVLLERADFSDSGSMAKTALELIDIIEGVKYRFEPESCMCSLKEKDFKSFEGKKVNILFMTTENYGGPALFLGENPPAGAIHASLVPSSIASFIAYRLVDNDDGKLDGITSILGRKSLINTAIHYSLGEFGAELTEEQEGK